MNNELNKYEIWQPFLLAAMVAIGMIIGNKMSNRSQPLVESVHSGSNSPVGRVEEIVRFIESRYVDSLDSDEILEHAITSIIGDLDPHSVYLPPEQLVSINEKMEGSYRGVGVESFYLDDTVRISKVLPGTPAQEAGIKSFDKLVSIDDSIVSGKKLEYQLIREMLRAEKKDEIKLGVVRKGEDDLLYLNLKPDRIALHSSNVYYEISEDVGYIKIDRFSSNTYKEFMVSFESLVEDYEIKSLIIDLRGNPGGYLPQTVNILSQLFNEKGKLLVYTSGKNGKKTEYKSTGKNFFALDKIAVLIDEGSASGSEIIAGALQDWDRALVIGRRSFGKGLVQEQYSLNNGGAIRLTTARYYTPSGRSIQKPYEDIAHYDEDIHQRYRNGEMYASENMSIQDTTTYKTLLLEREMFGGGGIYPDIFIPLDSSYSVFETERITAYLPEYVYNMRADHIEIGQNQEVDISRLWSYLAEKGLKIEAMQMQVNKDEVHNRLLAEFTYQEKNNLEKEKLLNKTDPFIQEALNYILSSKNLRDYQQS